MNSRTLAWRALLLALLLPLAAAAAPPLLLTAPAPESGTSVLAAPNAAPARETGAFQTEPDRTSAKGFLKAYLDAQAYEPTFQTSKAEKEFNQVGASVARAAYWPQLQYSNSRLETESQTRTTLTLTQPILALDRFATYREGAHRDSLSELTFRQREQELAVRVFKAIADIIRNRESLVANEAKIRSLTQQYESARKMFMLGEGTITDQRDTQVRLGQARADGLTLSGNLRAAERQFELICGRPLGKGEFQLTRQVHAFPLKPDDLASPARDAQGAGNTQIDIAVRNYELAKLASLKAKSSILPTIMGSYSHTEAAGVKTQYAGLSLSLPLQAPSIYGMYSARANEFKQRESVREAESKAQLEVEKLKALVQAGIEEVRYRQETIDAAELNVTANEKSLQGGVRSKNDVLNAIQLRYQAHSEYVTSALTLAENYVNLLLTANIPPEQALDLVNRLIL